ncbi:diiron oxygenase [Pseudomonas orientalis]|uniref:diiron oxygenase n=1 Tax=Pseudomonas orientalis TaxID=76758 RepID=UPI0034D66692
MPESQLLNKITDTWYAKATVRSTPRILVPDYSSEQLIYPVARCSICEHPLVLELGPQVRSYILTQAAYQFLYGVGLLETKFVIQCCLDMLHNNIKDINDAAKLQALTVIVDEGYHAHVALDYIIQMKKKSAIDPLEVPQTNRKLDATARAYASLPESMRMDFQLLAVTLAENVLTDEVANLGRERELAQSFTTLMMDHVRDEGRHSRFFADLMKERWPQLPRETQEHFSLMLPAYLDDFLGADLSRGFERKILAHCGLTEAQAEQVIHESDPHFSTDQARMKKSILQRIYRLLNQIGVLELDSVKDAFSDRNYVTT